MSFVDDPMYPVKKLCWDKMYGLYTASSTIVMSSASMLLLLSRMQWDSACLSCSCEQNTIVACVGTSVVTPGSTDAL